MQEVHRNASLKSTKSAMSEIVSPLGRLENVNKDQRRTSVISQDSVATTGRLLDKLGLDDIDDYDDLESIDEQGNLLPINDETTPTTKTFNYASADKFRSLRAHILDNNFRSGKDSAAKTALAIGSSIHNVHVSKLVVPNTGHRTSLKGEKIDTPDSEDVTHFKENEKHENGQKSFTFPKANQESLQDDYTEGSDNEDNDTRSFEYGDDIEITASTTVEDDEEVNFNNDDNTSTLFKNTPPDNSHIFVNPSYQPQPIDIDKKSRVKGGHAHSFSNPGDIVPSSWKPKSFSPKSPLTKIFHHKFYHITAPDFIASNPDDLKSPSSSSLISHSPSSSINKAHITTDIISSPIPSVPPSRFKNYSGTLPSGSSHMRALSTDGDYRDLSTRPLISHMRTTSALELDNHTYQSIANPRPESLNFSGNIIHGNVAPRSFTAPVTYGESTDEIDERKENFKQEEKKNEEKEKEDDTKEKSPFKNRLKPSSIIITDTPFLPDILPSPRLPGTPGRKSKHPYSQYRSGNVSSPSRPAFRKPTQAPPPLPSNDNSQIRSIPSITPTKPSHSVSKPLSNNTKENIIPLPVRGDTSSTSSASMEHPQSDNNAFSTLTPESRVSMAIALRKSGQSKEAANQLQIAASQGNRDAMLLYGLSLRYGYGLHKDEKESFAWICKAGDVIPFKRYQFNIDPLKLESERTGEEGIAKENHTLASIMFEIGQAYMYGWGVERNESQGIEFVEKSASLGYVDAMCECGTFWNKKGFNHRKKDMKRAASWFRLSEKFGAKLIGSSWIYKAKYLFS